MNNNKQSPCSKILGSSFSSIQHGPGPSPLSMKHGQGGIGHKYNMDSQHGRQ